MAPRRPAWLVHRTTISFICIITDLNIGEPHRLVENDVYEGYFIPKGSIVIGNIQYVRNTH